MPYTKQELCDRTGLTGDTFTLYERVYYLFHHTDEKRGKAYLYSDSTLQRIETILQLKSEGLSLKEIQKRLTVNDLDRSSAECKDINTADFETTKAKWENDPKQCLADTLGHDTSKIGNVIIKVTDASFCGGTFGYGEIAYIYYQAIINGYMFVGQILDSVDRERPLNLKQIVMPIEDFYMANILYHRENNDNHIPDIKDIATYLFDGNIVGIDENRDKCNRLAKSLKLGETVVELLPQLLK